jgi:LacI family transcriptional regulator
VTVNILPEAERPTLKTIASLTGLSVASVSRALKDADDIGEETKVRVREVAAQVGYRPNRAGVRLRTGRTNVIALVMSAESDVMNHTSRLIYSVASALRGTAFHMIVVPFFPDEDPMVPIRYIWETRSADGVIINQIKPNDPRVAFMQEHGLPFATHGRSNMGTEHPYFDFDNDAFCRLAVRAMVERGCRSLALITPPREQSYGQHMIAGFLAETQALGVTGRLVEGVTSDDTSEKLACRMTALFSSESPPDGVIAGSTTAAMTTVAAAEGCGLVLGKDFQIGAKEAIPILDRFRRGMIVVREDVSHAGDFLARAVMAAIEHPDAPLMQGLEQPRL